MKSSATRNTRAAVVRRLVNLLTDPEEGWSFDRHTARHIRTGMELWIANGPLFLDTFPVNVSLSLIDRYRIWKAVRVAKDLWVLKQATAPEDSHE